jgi:hypothetical protein
LRRIKELKQSVAPKLRPLDHRPVLVNAHNVEDVLSEIDTEYSSVKRLVAYHDGLLSSVAQSGADWAGQTIPLTVRPARKRELAAAVCDEWGVSIRVTLR